MLQNSLILKHLIHSFDALIMSCWLIWFRDFLNHFLQILIYSFGIQYAQTLKF